jgi:hypothetical protein
MDRRSSRLSLRLGWLTVLALAAAWAATGPASAQVVGVRINPTATLSGPGGASMTVSGTVTSLCCWNYVEIQVFQDQGQQTTFGFATLGFETTWQQPQGWIVTVPAFGPGFKSGKANVIVTVYNGPVIQAAATVSVKPK